MVLNIEVEGIQARSLFFCLRKMIYDNAVVVGAINCWSWIRGSSRHYDRKQQRNIVFECFCIINDIIEQFYLHYPLIMADQL